MAIMFDQAALARHPCGEAAGLFRDGDEIFVMGNLRVRAHSNSLIADRPGPDTPHRAGRAHSTVWVERRIPAFRGNARLSPPSLPEYHRQIAGAPHHRHTIGGGTWSG